MTVDDMTKGVCAHKARERLPEAPRDTRAYPVVARPVLQSGSGLGFERKICRDRRKCGDSSKLSENPGGLRGQSVTALNDRNARGCRRRIRRMFSEPGLASPPFDKISPENNSSEHRKPRQAKPLPCCGIGNPGEHREFLGVKGLVQSPLFEDGFQPDALELEIVRHALGQAASKGEVRGGPCEPGALRRHSTSADSWTSCRFTTFQSGGGGRVEQKNYGRIVLR